MLPFSFFIQPSEQKTVRSCVISRMRKIGPFNCRRIRLTLLRIERYLRTKKERIHCLRSFMLVGTVGIEPMTSCMSSMRSNQLSYAPAQHCYYTIVCFMMQLSF